MGHEVFEVGEDQTQEKRIVFVKHPISPQAKRALLGKFDKIVDIKFAPPAGQLGDNMTIVELADPFDPSVPKGHKAESFEIDADEAAALDAEEAAAAEAAAAADAEAQAAAAKKAADDAEKQAQKAADAAAKAKAAKPGTKGTGKTADAAKAKAAAAAAKAAAASA